MRQVHKPEGWVHWTKKKKKNASIKIQAQVYYFVNSQALSKYTVINLILT